MFGVIGRLTQQKGFDVLAHALERLLGWNLQIVLLGSGDTDAERFFAALAYQRGDKFRAYIGFDEGLSHRIEAGSDFFLMPSRFEPCGLAQLYAMRYGSIPIVHAVGGLRDTVEDAGERSVVIYSSNYGFEPFAHTFFHHGRRDDLAHFAFDLAGGLFAVVNVLSDRFEFFG